MKNNGQIEKKIKSLVKDYIVLYNDYCVNIDNITVSNDAMRFMSETMAQLSTLQWVSGINIKRYFPKEIIIYGN